jgi:uncharacterized transporter YbjL
MTSPLIQRILGRIIAALIADGRLVLVEGADADQLTGELAGAISSAPGFTQFGTWLADALLASPLVDDLYATDTALSELLREVEP